jgi:hypothetical protein
MSVASALTNASPVLEGRERERRNVDIASDYLFNLIVLVSSLVVRRGLTHESVREKAVIREKYNSRIFRGVCTYAECISLLSVEPNLAKCLV